MLALIIIVCLTAISGLGTQASTTHSNITGALPTASSS
jgi:Flp pilus assembly pilin Flp